MFTYDDPLQLGPCKLQRLPRVVLSNSESYREQTTTGGDQREAALRPQPLHMNPPPEFHFGFGTRRLYTPPPVSTRSLTLSFLSRHSLTHPG